MYNRYGRKRIQEKEEILKAVRMKNGLHINKLLLN